MFSYFSYGDNFMCFLPNGGHGPILSPLNMPLHISTIRRAVQLTLLIIRYSIELELNLIFKFILFGSNSRILLLLLF